LRDPRGEAYARLEGRYEVRVLEPSPPAVQEPPWFADDPCARGRVPTGRRLVSPVGTGDVLWDELAREDTSLQEWCADRWLGAYRRLSPAPASLARTRIALHRLAEHVISPARRRANGKIALRYTGGGFGTPFFGADLQVRVEGVELLLDGLAATGAAAAGATGERRGPIETLSRAAALIGVELEVEDERLDVDPAAARFLADWFGFTASVLEELRAESGPELEPSRAQLWPEHFDLATELGPEAAGRRAGFGGSPGDDLHDEPYVYVVPWEGSRAAGELWNATAFKGAELSYQELLETSDQRAAALGFMRERLRALRS
jgi:hypothetical protein